MKLLPIPKCDFFALMGPIITSQFMTRAAGDRPNCRTRRLYNLGLIGAIFVETVTISFSRWRALSVPLRIGAYKLLNIPQNKYRILAQRNTIIRNWIKGAAGA